MVTAMVPPLCPVPVIGAGPGWLVVEKPAGMSVHNDPHHDLCAAIKTCLQGDRRLLRRVGMDPAYGLHAVHRLDKETSGVILLACRRETFQHFSRQFSQGEVGKRYLALVHGAVAPADGQSLWQWPLSPKAAGRSNLQGQDRRLPSRTRISVLRISAHYTLVACQPLTGRTHQIRRHAALAGHPIVGDRRYGSLRACRYVAQHRGFTRLALHAAGLGIRPPESAGGLTFESAGLPAEMKLLIDDD
jgi:23S rRNA pseudouridine1911/1915/1917 synthase